MDTSTLGLMVLIIAWLIQMIYSLLGKKEIQKTFLVVYAVGALILVAGEYNNGTLSSRGMQNLVMVVFIAVILAMNMLKKRGK